MTKSYHVTQLPLLLPPAETLKPAAKLKLAKDEVIQYYLDGHTLTQTGLHFDVSITSVNHFLKRHGIEIRGHKVDLMARFNRFVEVQADGCWLWTGHVHKGGYGQITVRRHSKDKSYRAHRLAYELYKGPIPEGLTLDHLCYNILCVNPEHLEPVTSEENIKRAAMRRKIKAELPWQEMYIELYREVYNENATEVECIEYAQEQLKKRSNN
jgi:hypothetical protein